MEREVAPSHHPLLPTSRSCAAHNRDLMIRQRRRSWQRLWKIDSASFQTISRLSQVARLLKRRDYMLELKRRGGLARPSSERDVRIYRLAVPVLKKNLKFGHFTSTSCRDGKEMYKKAWCKVVVLLTNPITFWSCRCRRQPSFVRSLLWRRPGTSQLPDSPLRRSYQVQTLTNKITGLILLCKRRNSGSYVYTPNK